MSRDPADVVADALLDTWRHLMAAHPDAWTAGSDGVQACATGIPSPGLNGVWSTRLDPDPAELDRLLDDLVARERRTCCSSGPPPTRARWRSLTVAA